MAFNQEHLEESTSGRTSATVAETPALDSQEPRVYLFPAGLEQSRYWILDQLEQASTASNMAIAFRLEGLVDDRLVEQAVVALCLRHEALRTNFRMIDGVLSQVISEEPRYHFFLSDLRDLPGDRPEEAAKLVEVHGRIAIDLAEGAIFFVRLIHVSDRDHYLAFTLHHIVCDGWSNGILVRDFAELYAALREKRSAFLPELPFQLADFTLWQQSWLESEAAQGALAFWQEHIHRDMPAVDIPTDFPRSAKKSAPGRIESQLLPAELNARIKQYCRQHDATMHQVLLSAFEALIARYTGQEEFVLGSTIANRTQPSMENVVGRFAHPQAILADVRGNPSFVELLGRVVDWSSKAYAHQDLPFSRLMEEFQLDQQGATKQFLGVDFVYQKAFMQPQRASDLKIVPRPSVSGGVNFDLLTSIVERAEGSRLQIEYNTTLFSPQRISRLLGMYIRVLEAVMRNDSLHISELPLGSQEEQEAIRVAGIGSSLEELPVDSIAHAFDRWAEERGDAPAIIAGTQRVSWRALRNRSRCFAGALKQLGIHAGQTVALRMEPTPETAAAAIAILRIGAVVLPVPGKTGAGETTTLLANLRPALSLAGKAFAARSPGITSLEELGLATAESGDLPYPSAKDPAWLGIRIDGTGSYHVTAASHEATLRSMAGVAQAVGLTAGAAVLVLAAPSCVESWTDVLLPLIFGACIVYPTDESAEQMQSVLDREQVAFAFACPADMSNLLDAGWKGDRRLNFVCHQVGLRTGNLHRLANAFGNTKVLYSSPATAGPFAFAETRPYSSARAPLQPLPGQRLSIVDLSGAISPFGVPGELSALIGERLVRCGAVAHYSPEAGIEFRGDSDRVIQLGGRALNLAELENLCSQAPQVATVDATLIDRTGDRPVLAAYVTARGSKALSVPDVKAFVKSAAPEYLASAQIVAVESIPRRIDGSANFLDLRFDEPPQASSARGTSVGPRDEMEAKLIRIWEDVLGIRGIGIRDSFFSLGGYSLMVVRLFARMNKALGTSLPITTVFNAPTIEQLADILRGRTVFSPLVPVQPRGTKPPFFLIHSYLIYQGLRSALGEDRPFYGLRELNEDGDITLEERVASYIREIRSVQPTGPYYIGGWCAAGPLAVEIGRQLAEAGEEVAAVVLFDSWRPGYAAELANTRDPEMATVAVLRRKYRFHRLNMERLSMTHKASYLWARIATKLRSVRNQLYVRNWASTHRVFTSLGIPLPHIMQNGSLKTLNSIATYKGKPFPGRITLIRAADTPYFHNADPSCGWNTMAEKGVEVLFAPGTHESMFLESNLSETGETLGKCLEQRDKSGPTQASIAEFHMRETNLCRR